MWFVFVLIVYSVLRGNGMGNKELLINLRFKIVLFKLKSQILALELSKGT